MNPFVQALLILLPTVPLYADEPSAGQKPFASPEECLQAVLKAREANDTRAYCRCFTDAVLWLRAGKLCKQLDAEAKSGKLDTAAVKKLFETHQLGDIDIKVVFQRNYAVANLSLGAYVEDLPAFFDNARAILRDSYSVGYEWEGRARKIVSLKTYQYLAEGVAVDEQGRKVATIPFREYDSGWLLAAQNETRFHTQLTRIERQALVRLSLIGRVQMDSQFANSVEHVQITDPSITDDQLTWLAKLRSVARLDLQDSQTTDAGLHHFRDVKDLLVVNLSNTRVTELALKELQRHKTLTHVFLRNIDVSQSAMDDFARQLPDCTVHVGWLIQPRFAKNVEFLLERNYEGAPKVAVVCEPKQRRAELEIYDKLQQRDFCLELKKCDGMVVSYTIRDTLNREAIDWLRTPAVVFFAGDGSAPELLPQAFRVEEVVQRLQKTKRAVTMDD